MAGAVPFTPAEVDLISSLSEDEIPTKLRCAICSKLAVNAYKTPCCEQLIDESCHSTLPTTCPVCEHTPLSAADCNPNKAMRSTVRVFLKTELKKRETSRAKEAKESAPPTPVDSRPNSRVATGNLELAAAEPVKDTAPAAATDGSKESQQPKPARDEAISENAEMRVSVEAPTHEDQPHQAQPLEAQDSPKDTQVVAKDTEDVLNPESAGHDPDTQQSGDGGQPTANGANNGPGYDMGGNASFAGMTYGGDFNQMQMMMAMQNGMMPNFNFPMMGMPNAGMDPMMQNMYMNGGFGSQGMGMNGMNMMGGGYGTTGSNWSGQQSWDIGQDNYNHPSAVGNGDYGSYNSGFHTGHNQQGNFGHQSSYGFQRGYGRGRGGRGRGYNGGYGRGGYNNFGPQGSYQDRNFTPQHYGNGHIDQASNQPLPPSTVSGNNEEPGGVDEFGRTTNLRRDSGSDQREDGEQGAAQKALGAPLSETGADLDGPIPAPGGEKTSGETPPGQGSGESSQAVADSTDAVTEAVASQSAEDVSATERGPGPSSSSGFAAQSRSEKGGSMPPPAVPSPDVPLNAPSGPKAMRQGLPNTSVVHLRARGFNVAGERGPRPAANDPAIPSPSFERGLRSRSSSRDRSKRQDTTRHRDRSRDPARAEEPARERDERREDKDHSRSGSRSSRSRSRDRKDSHRRRRHHSEPASESEREENGHHRSKHRSSRRLTAYDDEGEPKSARPRDEKHDERSRSASPEDSRRSGHRSRRDRDLDKRRDRERDKERGRDDQRSHRRRGSHRERDYDRDYDRDRERKDREKDKDRARDRHHERGHRHRGSKDTNEVPTSMDAPKDSKPPAGPRSNKALYSFEIKGASSRSRDGPQQPRRGSQASSSKAAPVAASPTGDPYQAEREKRQRERLVAEAQKLAGLQGIAGAKRGRDEGDDGRRNRRKGRRGDVVNMDEMGERLRRGEAERESFRAA